MADAITSITVFHQTGTAPAKPASLMVLDTSRRSEAVAKASELLAQIAGGTEGGTVAIRVDSATGTNATGSFTCVQASCTAGDKLLFCIPGYATPFILTAVSGTPAARNGEYAIISSNTAVGDSIVAAITAMPGLSDIVSAVNAAGTVTWTARKAGIGGPNIAVHKQVTTGAAHVITDSLVTSGVATSTKPTQTVQFGAPDIVANDTISVGGRKYTWKASASADGEITLSTTPNTAATNFGAAINADTTWTGLLTASVSTDTVTLTWEGDPRCGKHLVITFAETNSGSIVLGGAAMSGEAKAFTATTTVTGSSVTKRYQIGGP